MTSILIKGGTVITAGQSMRADILQVDGVITKVGVVEEVADEIIHGVGYLVFPGLIDCHVHFREPGYEHKATMKSEAASARAGGVTCVCDMPNTKPPTTTITALSDKVRRAQEVTDCDIRFFFGVTSGIHLVTLKDLWTSNSEELQHFKKYCCGVKLYLDHSTGDQKIEEDLIDEVFLACAECKIPIIAHCEDPQINSDAKAANQINDVSAHSANRPSKSEAIAIKKAVALVRKYGTQFHVAHLSSKRGLEEVVKAKEEGLPVTCEVAPHHLLLSTLDYKTLGTLCKMNPPVRSVADNEALWQALEDGTVDCIATDHAPHTLAEKQEGNPLDAPSGVPGVETALPILLNRLKPERIYELMFANPNRIFNLGKEDLVIGSKANIVIVDPTIKKKIHAVDLHSKCDWTPFEGREVRGEVVRVL
ncbi:MAG: dihydroorotase family protein [bacterium]|nr:dihydroorotase family protein [bacterium]